MARIRTIKPEFWLDEDLSELSCETHMFAAALLNHCDDEGYFKANPKLLHAQIFALRDTDSTTTVLVQNLEKTGYLTVFTGTDGKKYGHVTNFNKHQTINKAKPSKIKGLKPVPYPDGTPTEQLPLGKEQGTGKGKEQGKERKASIPAESPCENIETLNDDQKIQDIKSGYAFHGETIKLNQKDFNAWQKLYPNLNLSNELSQLDMEVRGDKKWFSAASAKLNYRNKNALNNKKKFQGRTTVNDHNQQAMEQWLADNPHHDELEVNPNEQ